MNLLSALFSLFRCTHPEMLRETRLDGRYFVCAAPLGTGADQEGWLRASHEAFQPVSRKGFPGTFTDFVVVRK